MTGSAITRRRLLALAGAAGLSGLLPAGRGRAGQAIHMKAIPSSGESIPTVGMGTWITFNVGEDARLRAHRKQILEVFFARGGGMIDSSPMYGSAEAVVGWCLERLADTEGLFSATKVWTPMTASGPEQMAHSRRLWGVAAFDLMQVHNLVDWRTHLETLKRDKAEGRIRYLGVTTSHGRRHGELEEIMRREPLDFVQLTYNIKDRRAEDRLLPLARDRGVAVIANRPFKHKQLFLDYQHRPLPDWAGEIGCANWAQFFLKFLTSHPAVTCAIPATSQVPHMEENMGALTGRLPDAAMRREMVRYVESA